MSTIKGNLQSLGLSCVISLVLLQGLFAIRYMVMGYIAHLPLRVRMRAS